MSDQRRTRKQLASLADAVMADPKLSKLPSRELARRYGCSEWVFRRRRYAAAGRFPRSKRKCPCCGWTGVW